MKLFTKAEQRYKINSQLLKMIRESQNFSVAQFAELFRWSASYQYKLESGKIVTMSEKTKKRIEVILARYF